MDATILVVDDNPDIVEAVKEIFEAKSPKTKVLSALSGEEAMKLISKRRPDLVLLDIMMPKMSGWDVAASMKENDKLRNIPIIYLTAKTDKLSMDMGQLSSEDYIVKPFDSDDLVKRVGEVLAKEGYVKGQVKLFRM